jgi:hypothetical protein
MLNVTVVNVVLLNVVAPASEVEQISGIDKSSIQQRNF